MSKCEVAQLRKCLIRNYYSGKLDNGILTFNNYAEKKLRERTMKIMLIVVSVILAATAAGSGYYIYSLNGQIDNLNNELAFSFSGLDKTLNEEVGRLDEADTKLKEELASSNETISEAITNTNSQLTNYTQTTGSRLTGVESDIKNNSSRIDGLQTVVNNTEYVINTTVLKSQELYEKVKKAIVRISDGERLLGSGFIVSFPSGEKFVVTAYHVVKGAPIVSGFPEIYITLYDGRTWKALFSGRSEDADIAIIAPITLPDRPLLYTDTLPSVELSNSGDVKVGEAVFVMGSPGDDQDSRLGLSETMTTGVISQINRGATIGGKYVADLLQFDAASNFGNSGGPLFNSNGEVIGVVIARVNPLLGDGISFAVKSSQITNVWSNFTPGELGGRALTSEEFSPMYKYPWTGLTVRDITPREMFTVENALTAGAKVTGVTGPASTADIKVGDIITMIDNREVTNSDEFYSFLAEYYDPGDSVILKILRGQEELSITLEVQEKP